MIRGDIKELHFISHIDNLPSLMKWGILSRKTVKRKISKFSDISEEGVQDRRAGKKIPGTKMELHDYVNLYFDAHNPMLSKRRSKNSEICVLRIKSEVLDRPEVIITDMNAAKNCWFKTVEDGLKLLDKNEVYATYWTDNDPWEYERKKGIKCAEVLVPGTILQDEILGAYVANKEALMRFQMVSNLSVETKPSLFF